jgi:hypothetical protein
MPRDVHRDDMWYGDHEDDEPDDGTRPADAGAYWRRRFLILCAGVVVLGACALLFPGAHHAQSQPSAAASASMAALTRQQSLPPAATGSAWQPPSPKPSPKPSPSARPSPSATPSASAKKSKQKVSTSYHPHSSASPSDSGGAKSCASGDIVLSLFAGKSSYTAGDKPTFSVYAVSTGSAPCTLPYGAGAVSVVVTRHGQVVWDSAACKPAAAKPVQFTQGVPQVLTLTWNRKAAGPAGCAGSLPASASGTLDAVALPSGSSGGKSSPVATFKIS